ncbi:MAG TPA: class I SAM-dependent methyltransferase [Draconibacterium sp.]|nr:class I SAM-dependent methyltransferase [Draconibacterium sp.]
MNKEILNIVHCVNCGKPDLTLHKEGQTFICTNCKQEYSIHGDVPLFIQQKDKERVVETEIHKKQGTAFQYVDHYQKDGVEYDYFEDRDPGTEHADRRVQEYILSKIGNKSGKILDVGCGRAWVAQEMCPKNFEVVSMDISLENTTEALKRYPFENHSAVVADVFSLPFNENVFDYIIASEIIEHVADPAAFVENLMYVLKPGGSLIVTTPYKEKIKYTLCVHCNKLTPIHAHLHSFDEKILISLYTGSDLNSCEYVTFGNKIPVHFRMHVFLKYLNFWCWKKVDQFWNFIYKAPLRILVKWDKKVA